MKRNSIKSASVMAALTCGLAMASVPPANATEAGPAPSGTSVTLVTSEATSTVSDVAKSVNGVSVSSRTKVVEYVQANGATKAQMQGKHYRLKHGRLMWTSYINTAGKEVWHWKWYAAGHLFVKGSDGYWHDPECWNKVVGIPNGKKHVGTKIYGAIKVVKHFSFSVKSLAKAASDALAHAKAWCTNPDGSGASGEADGSASAAAAAYASASGSSWLRATSAAHLAASRNVALALKLDSLSQLKGRTASQAMTNASASASAKAVCTGASTENKKPTGEIVQFAEHLFPGGEYRYKVAGSDNEDGGNVDVSYTVTGAAHKIVDADHPETCDVENTNKVCYFWVKAGSSTGNFTVTLTVTDSKGQTFTASVTKPVVADEF